MSNAEPDCVIGRLLFYLHLHSLDTVSKDARKRQRYSTRWFGVTKWRLMQAASREKGKLNSVNLARKIAENETLQQSVPFQLHVELRTRTCFHLTVVDKQAFNNRDNSDGHNNEDRPEETVQGTQIDTTR